MNTVSTYVQRLYINSFNDFVLPYIVMMPAARFHFLDPELTSALI